jgi:hypothetical protein
MEKAEPERMAGCKFVHMSGGFVVPHPYSSTNVDYALKKYDPRDAASRGDVRVLQRLARTNPSALYEVDGGGWTPLHEAVRSGHVDVVQFLIDNGANYNEITVQDWSPLYIARHYLGEDHPMTKLLANLGATHVGPEL